MSLAGIELQKGDVIVSTMVLGCRDGDLPKGTFAIVLAAYYLSLRLKFEFSDKELYYGRECFRQATALEQLAHAAK